MKKSIVGYVAIAFLAACAGCASPGARNIQISDSILKTGRESGQGAVSSAAEFRRADFTKEKLERYPDSSLSHVFKALNRMSFLFPENDLYVSLQQDIITEKIRRGKYTDPEIRQMFSAYLRARLFDKAYALEKEFPLAGLPVLPEKIADNLSEKDALRAYSVSRDGKDAEMTAVSLDKGPKLVMVMFTGCSVAEKAMREITADPELSAAFKKYGVLLTASFDAQGITKWKKDFNFSEIYIVNKVSDFAMFDFRSSPDIYLLKDGRLESKLYGWGRKSKEELHKALSRILQ